MCSSEWKVCLSHHCVLIIKFNDNNGRVISQFAGLSEQLHVLKNQQLVPSWTQRLRQHLRGETFCPSVFMQMEKALVKKKFWELTSVTWLCVEKKTLAKGSDRPVLSAANRLRAWYMWTRSWKICFTGRRQINHKMNRICVSVQGVIYFRVAVKEYCSKMIVLLM